MLVLNIVKVTKFEVNICKKFPEGQKPHRFLTGHDENKQASEHQIVSVFPTKDVLFEKPLALALFLQSFAHLTLFSLVKIYADVLDVSPPVSSRHGRRESQSEYKSTF